MKEFAAGAVARKGNFGLFFFFLWKLLARQRVCCGVEEGVKALSLITTIWEVEIDA
jgi:hypothetical protein